MSRLKVALVVPDNRSPGVGGGYRKAELVRRCHFGEIDLVVHDECFLHGPLERAHDVTGGWAAELRVPVLSGYYSDEGFITACYANPRPKRGETGQHLYFKHSSANKLPYERDSYQGREDPMFDPISLGGHRIGVMVCHDMFFGLITARYLEKGVSALFDLTAGNVQLKKWRMVMAARSMELEGPALCTMALMNDDLHGKAAAIAYDNGCAMQPAITRTSEDGTGGFEIYELAPPGSRQTTSVSFDQSFSSKVYDEILISLGGSDDADAVIEGERPLMRFKRPTEPHGPWRGFETSAGPCGILLLPTDALWDPRVLYAQRPKPGAFAHHLVVYHSPQTPEEVDRVLAMAAMRAIEHRIAACVMAGTMREVLKTDNYKKIQRLRERNGIFGLPGRNLGGTATTWSHAIPQKMFGRYLELLA